MSEIIKFPKLVDSSIETSIVSLNENMINSKDRNIQINLTLLQENHKIENLRMYCDYSTMMNLNYKLKSACNQIEESIKHFANK
jgi:hypothetical protein